jgi:hypothetical protein
MPHFAGETCIEECSGVVMLNLRNFSTPMSFQRCGSVALYALSRFGRVVRANIVRFTRDKMLADKAAILKLNRIE